MFLINVQSFHHVLTFAFDETFFMIVIPTLLKDFRTITSYES
jgi:hypothetical protein